MSKPSSSIPISKIFSADLSSTPLSHQTSLNLQPINPHSEELLDSNKSLSRDSASISSCALSNYRDNSSSSVSNNPISVSGLKLDSELETSSSISSSIVNRSSNSSSELITWVDVLHYRFQFLHQC